MSHKNPLSWWVVAAVLLLMGFFFLAPLLAAVENPDWDRRCREGRVARSLCPRPARTGGGKGKSGGGNPQQRSMVLSEGVLTPRELIQVPPDKSPAELAMDAKMIEAASLVAPLAIGARLEAVFQGTTGADGESYEDILAKAGFHERTARNYRHIWKTFGDCDRWEEFSELGVTKMLTLSNELSRDEIEALDSGKPARGIRIAEIRRMSSTTVESHMKSEVAGVEKLAVKLKRTMAQRDAARTAAGQATEELDSAIKHLPAPADLSSATKLNAGANMAVTDFRSALENLVAVAEGLVSAKPKKRVGSSGRKIFINARANSIQQISTHAGLLLEETKISVAKIKKILAAAPVIEDDEAGDI